MRTISQLINNEIQSRPLIEEGLANGVINLSALARQLKPKIEQVNLKKTSVGAIVMALHRLGIRLRKQTRKKDFPKVSDITMRSHLVEFTFKNLSQIEYLREKVSRLASSKPNSFVSWSQAMFETTLIVNEPLDLEIRKIFPKKGIINEIKNLSSVIIRFEESTIYTPGVYYQILKALAWENINLIEIISVSNEISLFFEDKEIERAFMVVKNLNT